MKMKYYFRKEPMDMTGCVEDFIKDVEYHAERGDELLISTSLMENSMKIKLKSGLNFHYSDNDYWQHNNNELPIIIGIKSAELDEGLFEL